MREVEEFDKRFAKKMMQGIDVKDVLNNMADMRNSAQMSMMQMFGSKPGAGDAFIEMGKELSKIKGTRVMEVTRMGGSGTGMQAQPGDDTPPPTAGQVAGTERLQPLQPASSHFGLGGSAIGGLMGGFGHKKKQDPPPPRRLPPPPRRSSDHNRSHPDGDDHADAQLLRGARLVDGVRGSSRLQAGPIRGRADAE